MFLLACCLYALLLLAFVAVVGLKNEAQNGYGNRISNIYMALVTSTIPLWGLFIMSKLGRINWA